MEQGIEFDFTADDGHTLLGRLYGSEPGAPVLIVNGATAVQHEFYHRFAQHMSAKGWTVLTYDYRGSAGVLARRGLRRSDAVMSDWGLKDMQGAVDFISEALDPPFIGVVGHSAGGQQIGLMPRPERVDAMVTVCAQSGYWRLQGGSEKFKVFLAAYVIIPLLTRLNGYFPWRWFGGSDLPRGVALQWAKWCRSPKYLMGDKSLPTERFADFQAPVLAYSIEDDAWGTEVSVRAMMEAYPNVTYEHLVPEKHGLHRLRHLGFFRKGSEALWDKVHDWFMTKGV